MKDVRERRAGIKSQEAYRTDTRSRLDKYGATMVETYIGSTCPRKWSGILNRKKREQTLTVNTNG
jgi:hypothetical protein